jgi:hypothetical protein
MLERKEKMAADNGGLAAEQGGPVPHLKCLHPISPSPVNGFKSQIHELQSRLNVNDCLFKSSLHH